MIHSSVRSQNLAHVLFAALRYGLTKLGFDQFSLGQRTRGGNILLCKNRLVLKRTVRSSASRRIIMTRGHTVTTAVLHR